MQGDCWKYAHGSDKDYPSTIAHDAKRFEGGIKILSDTGTSAGKSLYAQFA